MSRKYVLNSLIFLLAAGSMWLLFAHRIAKSRQVVFPDSLVLRKTPNEAVGIPRRQAVGSARLVAAQSDTDPVAIKLRRLKKQMDDLYRIYPKLREELLIAYKLEFAMKYAEYFSYHGIAGEKRDLLLDLLADMVEAPSRGETGEREREDIKTLLGDEKYKAFMDYGKRQPGIQQADEIAAHFRASRVDLGDSAEQIRQIAEKVPASNLAMTKRMIIGLPLTAAEEQSLSKAAWNDYEPLRKAVQAKAGDDGLSKLDVWIAQKINGEIEILKQVLEAAARQRKKDGGS